MDKKIAGLLGAAAALTTMTGANAAAPVSALEATSYADLLSPVPNAVAQLIADDEARATRSRNGEMDVAQVRIDVDHHHHHHHRYRRRHKRHHHHHHHHSNFMAVPRADV
jgi:cobalamin biosynthesis protein CbiG